MRIAVEGPTGGPAPAVRLATLDLDPGEPARTVALEALPEALRDAEQAVPPPRWVWWSTLSRGTPSRPAPGYADLLRRGVRLDRVHDLALTERLLRGHELRSLEEAAWAALPLEEPPPAVGPDAAQEQLFDTPGVSALAAAPAGGPLLAEGHADQRRRIGAAGRTSPGFPLLVAAESAVALAAAEMAHAGLPWRVDVHDRVLTDLLGPRPVLGGRPPRLQALSDEVCAALGASGTNIDSHPDLLRALRRAGLPVRTTRKWELQRFVHPAIAPLLEYKELYRLHVAHGWSWADQWVRDGRFHPQYVPGGVVSGRWATRGGGALQIPKAVRAAVVPDPGWVLIGADAGQLEPRILAALSGDVRMGEATRAGDLYAALASQALGRAEARHEAKIALLSAMYGGGAGSPELAALKRRFPTAFELVEDAARTGENGGVVRSVLGRTCPPPSARELEWPDDEPVPAGLDDAPSGRDPAAVAAARGRARGRFTRNFVIQASAADWANVLIAVLRRRLAEPHDGAWHDDRPHLVFFQHDEVLVHAPADRAEEVCTAIRDAAVETTRLVLGDRGVPVPMEPKLIASYAEKG